MKKITGLLCAFIAVSASVTAGSFFKQDTDLVTSSGFDNTVSERLNNTVNETWTTHDNSTNTTTTHWNVSYSEEEGMNTYIFDYSFWINDIKKNADGSFKQVEITVQLEPNRLTRMLDASKEPYKSYKNNGTRTEWLNNYYNKTDTRYYWKGGDFNDSVVTKLEDELESIGVFENGELVKTTNLKDKPKNVTAKIKLEGKRGNKFGRVTIGNHSIVIQASSQAGWNDFKFNGTSADRDDNSGNLGIGRINGTGVLYDRIDSPGDGTTEDYSGNNNDGTEENFPADPSVNGIFSTTGITFDGSDDRIDHGDIAATEVSIPFTISVWTRSSNTNNEFILDEDDQSGSGNGYSLQKLDSSTMQLKTGGTNLRGGTASAIGTGDWEHWAFVVSGTADGDFEMYANCQQVTDTSNDNPSSLTYGSGSFRIGDVRETGDFAWSGDLDEIQVIDKALSQKDVCTDLFHYGRGGTFNGHANNTGINIPSEDLDVLQVNYSEPSETDFNVNVSCGGQTGFQQFGFAGTSLNTWNEVNKSIDKIDCTGGTADIEINGTTTNASRSFEIAGYTLYATTRPTISNHSFIPQKNNIRLFDNVTVYANVTDPDGDPITFVNLTVTEAATTILQDGQMTDHNNDALFNFTDAFNASQRDTYYNTTVEATDDQGNTQTSDLNVFIRDSPPTVTVRQPTNSTFYTYDLTYNYTVSNGNDDVPQEDLDCNVWNGTSLIDQDTGTQSYSRERPFRNDLQVAQSFNVTCTDPGGNTGNDSVFYTVDDFKLWSNSSRDLAYETFNTSYNFTVTVGDMATQFNSTLKWNASTEPTNTNNSEFVHNISMSEWFDIPIIDNNATTFNWSFNFTYNRTPFSGGSGTVVSVRPANASQEAWQSYFFQNSSFDPLSAVYIEGQDYTHKATIRNKSDRATLLSTNIYNRTFNQVVNSRLNFNASQVTFTGSQAVGNITNKNNLNETHGVWTETKVEFQDDSRFIVQPSNDTLTIEQVLITDCGSNTASQTVTISMTTFDEGTIGNPAQQVTSDVDTAFQVWKDPSIKRSFNFSSDGQTTHTFCIYPADATYTWDGTSEQTVYTGTGFETRSFYPLRQQISNSTTTVDLYLLNESASSDLIIELDDEEGDAATNKIMSIERYFPSQNSFIRVAMAKTGSTGETETVVKTGDEETYDIKVYNQASELIDQFTDVVITVSPLELQLGAVNIQTLFTFEGNTGATCSGAVASFNCTYTSSGHLSNISLRVEEQGAVVWEQVCHPSSTSSSGTLVCQGLNISQNSYRYSVIAEYTTNLGTVQETVLSDSFGNINIQYGDAGILVTVGLVVTLGFAGLFSAEAAIILAGIGAIIGFGTGFLSIGIGSLASIIFIGLVLLWRMN